MVQFLAESRSFAVLMKCPDLTQGPLYLVYLSSFKVENEGAIPLPLSPHIPLWHAQGQIYQLKGHTVIFATVKYHR